MNRINRSQWRKGFIACVWGVVVGASLLIHAQTETPVYEDHSQLLIWKDSAGGVHPVRTAEDWRKRRSHILLGMQRAMGALPSRDHLPPVDYETVDELVTKHYRRLTISLDARPDEDRIPAFLYFPIPPVEHEQRPAMLVLHQTHALGKGDVDIEAGRNNRIFASELAARGYIVLAPDYPSFGDLQDYDFEADAYISGTMKGIVNHLRCVDLLAGLPRVDADRIGVIGHSLGGHNAMFVGAFDERLKVVVSSCGWTPFHDYYDGRIAGWTSPRYMPLLRDKYELDADNVPFDFYEVVAALAPRGFFSSSPIEDGNFKVEGVRKAITEATKVFRLLDAENNLRVIYPDYGHDFEPDDRRAAYQFIDRMLKFQPTRQVP